MPCNGSKDMTCSSIQASKQGSADIGMYSGNALRAAAMAEETGRNTLGRLGAQGERIHNTEKNLDLTANHNVGPSEALSALQIVSSAVTRDMYDILTPILGAEFS